MEKDTFYLSLQRTNIVHNESCRLGRHGSCSA